MAWKALTALALLTASLPAHGLEPIKVAVVDTGLDLADPRFRGVLCPHGHMDFTGYGMRDMHGHGTHIAGLIRDTVGATPGYCLLIIKYHPGDSNVDHTTLEVRALEYAASQGATYVNLSSSGPGFDQPEYVAIRRNPGVTFVVAAGNEGKPLDLGYRSYPASYRLLNIVAVGNELSPGMRYRSSNYAPWLVWEPGVNIVSDAPCYRGICSKTAMTGTSQATAIHTGKLVKQLLDNRKGSGTYEQQNLFPHGPDPGSP